MKIAIAADHAGFDLKQIVVEHLRFRGLEVVDLGPDSAEPVDYPDMAITVAAAVNSGIDRGILICGTGIGMSIAANKVPGIRAALCRDEFSSRAAREHNDANVLVLGSRVTGTAHAVAIVDAWLTAGFAGGRHQQRVDKINGLDRASLE